MALQCVMKGSNAFFLSKEDINKYPGSLLHSLITSVDSSDGLVVNLDDLPDSMFVSWPAAVAITTELYRQGYIEAATLSGLLKQHTTADLLNKLQALIDYLLLPGPVAKYLPPSSKVPLIHVSVFDMYYQAAANDAVQAILSSTAFSDTKFRQDIDNFLYQRAAFFYLGVIPDDTCVAKIQAYAVAASSRCGSGWMPATTGHVATSRCILYNTTVVKLLPEGPEATLCNHDGSPVVLPIPADHKQLVPMIKAGLQEGLAAASSEVSGTEMHVTIVDGTVYDGRGEGLTTVPIWVLCW